jgi:hypothetical protein
MNTRIDPQGGTAPPLDWITELRAEQARLKADPAWLELEARLLAVAPGSVVPLPEPHRDELLARGAVIAGKVKTSRGGIINRCHLNAGVRWLRDPKALICTGPRWPPKIPHLWPLQIPPLDELEMM